MRIQVPILKVILHYGNIGKSNNYWYSIKLINIYDLKLNNIILNKYILSYYYSLLTGISSGITNYHYWNGFSQSLRMINENRFKYNGVN